MKTVRDTSIAAYNRIKDNNLLSKLRFEVYHVLFYHGPLTQGELWSRYFSDRQRHSIGPRFKELLDRTVIECVSERPCGLTGVLSMVWDVTSNLPRELKRSDSPPTRNEMIVALHKQLREITDYLDLQNAKIATHWQAWVTNSKILLTQCEQVFIDKKPTEGGKGDE